jgi:hypothetical protein
VLGAVAIALGAALALLSSPIKRYMSGVEQPVRARYLT